MHIQFLYFAECPSHEQALQRLRQALDDVQLTATIEVLEVTSDEQAQQLRFAGSPTILVEGEDLFSAEQGAVYGLTCRAYRLDDGRISPLPTVEMMRNALRQAQARTTP
jgi:hypothetical protein